uniref:Retrovirus-related Pol polyprotein from transposon TNT 1-94-like beta-barrel domain-containing protein n=1 Tax=Chenopodium quinoa TaxID=63459 RepID=A0A803LIT3_CHEQI
MQIEDYLYQKNLYLPLTSKPSGMKEDEWKVLDRQTLGVIRLTLAKSVAYNVKDVTTTVGVIKALSNMYEKPLTMNKVFLMRRLFEIEINDCGSTPEHINEFNSIISQLASVEIKFDDEQPDEHHLAKQTTKQQQLAGSRATYNRQQTTLRNNRPVAHQELAANKTNRRQNQPSPDQAPANIRCVSSKVNEKGCWDIVVAAISNSSEKSKLKCDDVRDFILNESLRRKNSGESSGGAYSSEGRGRGRQQRGAQRGRSNSRGRSKSKGKGGSNHKSHDDASSSVSLVSSDEIGDALILSVDSPIESWILDSGASFHSSPCKEIFQNFKSGKFGMLYLVDDEPLDIMGKEDVMIKTSSGSSWKLKDVRYIPKLRKNLISMGQLDSSDFRTMFGE